LFEGIGQVDNDQAWLLAQRPGIDTVCDDRAVERSTCA